MNATKKLNEVFGNEDWKRLYDAHGTLDGTTMYLRESGTKMIVDLYKKRLQELFKERLLGESLTLKNTGNTPLFELMFCTGHPNGIPASHRIARHIIKYKQNTRPTRDKAQRALELN